MGCCQSTEHDEAASGTPDDAASHPTTGTPRNAPEVSSPRTSSHAPRSHRPGRTRRNIGLREQYNEPLRPYTWTSERLWTRPELERERNAFFDTQVTGREEIWAALRTVTGMLAEGDIATAQGILNASAITLPRGDLTNGAYDESGNHYRLPDYIIADPDYIYVGEGEDPTEDEGEATDEEELERRREEKGKGVVRSEELIQVKVRLSDRGGPDTVVSTGQGQKVRVLVRRLKEQANIPDKTKVKLFYLGWELEGGKLLLASNWKEGGVVNAYVFS